MFLALVIASSMSWSMTLDGPWKFKTGDDARWADPKFDDSSWSTLSVAAPASANDGDQGISRFAAGWTAHGYDAYAGYAWYRIRVAAPADERTLELLGPAMVDSAYQIYADGRLLGGIGDFSRSEPLVYGIRPAKYVFSPVGRTVLVAVRVWMPPWAAGPGSGGMHVAPVLGDPQGADDVFWAQQYEKARAFALEIVQGCFFVLLAIGALVLAAFDRAKLGLALLALGMILTALVRVDLAWFWLSSVESVQSFVWWHLDVLVPVTLGAWTLAWCHLLRLRERKWISIATAVMTILYVAAEFLKRPTFDGGLMPGLAHASSLVSTADRYAFLTLLVYIAFRGIRERGVEAWFVLPAILCIAVGQFAGEIAALHVPSIWFPFGAGVSLANCAYVASTIAIIVLLSNRSRLRPRPA